MVGVIAMLLSSNAAWADNTPITNDGIGKVKLGAIISKLPGSVDGVYDRDCRLMFSI